MRKVISKIEKKPRSSKEIKQKVSINQLTGRKEEKLRLLEKNRPKCKLRQWYRVSAIQWSHDGAGGECADLPWEHFMLHGPAARCRPRFKGDILQNGESSAESPAGPAGEMGEDLGTLILAPSLCSSKPSTQAYVKPSCCPRASHPRSVLHIGNTFRRHPRRALEKDGFYADLFSQCAYQDPHVPSSSPWYWPSPAQQPARWQDL